LLPDATHVRLETWAFEPAQSALTINLRARPATARCPLCGKRSKRVHSRYQRTLADLPWGEHAATVLLSVRRLFCDNTRCERRIFAERLPDVAAPWARRTVRLAGRLTAVGLALGGAAGTRLGSKLGLPASRNTLLRLVRQAPLPTTPTPSVLGVDDWALRKRQTYGTVLIDLERGRPVALLPDREAGTLATWLREHPGVEVISRDRGGAYAKGAHDGAPAAVQVADRFHLLQNLAEALEVVFTAHAKDLHAAEQGRHDAVAAENGTCAVPPSKPPPGAQALAAGRRERRIATHGQVWRLKGEGWTAEAIGRHLGISRASVFRNLRHEAFAERERRADAGHSLLDPWQDAVLGHWNSGRRDGRGLFRELRQQGYRGSYATLSRYLHRLRHAQGGRPGRERPWQSSPVLAAAPRRVLTPRTATWLLLRRADKRSKEDQALLACMRAQAPDLDAAVGLAEAFTSLVRDRAPDRLDPWLKRAADGAVQQLQRFAKRLSADYDAVRAALMLDWSNGPVEGQINRLKTIKRQMYGRAGLDLLERRFLLAA
jgi:transposase